MQDKARPPYDHEGAVLAPRAREAAAAEDCAARARGGATEAEDAGRRR